MSVAGDVHDKTPVVVGVGRYTFHKNGRSAEQARFGCSPLELMVEAAQRALRDAGLSAEGAELHSIAHVASATDAAVLTAAKRAAGERPTLGNVRSLHTNTPAAVAAALGCPCESVLELVETGDSGATPQQLVNRAFEKISRGELQCAMIVGAEALHSFGAAMAAGATAADMVERWGRGSLPLAAAVVLDKLDKKVGMTLFPEGQTIEEANLIFTELERKHGLAVPIAAYPLFENALRCELGRSLAEQQAKVGELFAGFSDVAAANKEHSWFPTSRKPDDLTKDAPDNRRICYPFYNKRLNAVNAVDMSGAVLMMSAGEARRRGVPRDKWVFLHGCGEAADRKEFLERPRLGASPAIRLAGAQALQMAGIRDVNREVDFVDVYSCFPVAVQVACRELGIDEAAKPLTVTGGLPYHGGPGSNYVTHSIAASVERLRACAREARALVTANGGYLTKHAFGVYANFPDEAAVQGTWQREDPVRLQERVDQLPRALFTDAPNGRGVIETYCVKYGRSDPEMGIVIGRLVEGPHAGHRFVANTPRGDSDALRQFVTSDLVGAFGTVTSSGGRGTFTLERRNSRL